MYLILIYIICLFYLQHANNVRAMAESYVSRRLAKSVSLTSSTSLTTSVKVHHQHLLSLLRNQEDDLPILPAARPGECFLVVIFIDSLNKTVVVSRFVFAVFCLNANVWIVNSDKRYLYNYGEVYTSDSHRLKAKYRVIKSYFFCIECIY